MPTAVRRSAEMMVCRSSRRQRKWPMVPQNVAPLLLLNRVARGHEVGKGSEGHQVLGEKRSCPNIVDRLHVIGEALKPAADESDIRLLPTHDRLPRGQAPSLRSPRRRSSCEVRPCIRIGTGDIQGVWKCRVHAGGERPDPRAGDRPSIGTMVGFGDTRGRTSASRRSAAVEGETFVVQGGPSATSLTGSRGRSMCGVS
jgi:hypothetical protein